MTYQVRSVGHPTVFTYDNRIDAGIHARILESVGYVVFISSAMDIVCDDCGAAAGEPCRPYCTGAAAHNDAGGTP